MSSPDLIQTAESHIENNEWTEASETLNKVLAKDTVSFKAYLLKARVAHMTKEYVQALEDANIALKIAQHSNNKNDLTSVYVELAIIHFKLKVYEESLSYLDKAQESSSETPEVTTWRSVISKKFEKAKAKEGYTPAPKPSYRDIPVPIVPIKPIIKGPEVSYATPPAPVKPSEPASLKDLSLNPTAPVELRTDWYDSKEVVNLSIFVKRIPKETLKVTFKPFSVHAQFQNGSATSSYDIDPTFAELDTEKSSYRLFGTKLELYLHKKDTELKWTSLKQKSTENLSSDYDAVASYPSSSKKHIDWKTLDKEISEELEKDTETSSDPNDFFKKLYGDGDDDMRRAMMKSFVESDGTSLSTDWSEVSKGKVEPYKSDDDDKHK